MKKLPILCFFLLLGISYQASAQQFTLQLPPGHNKIVSTEKEKGIEGSPWLKDTWSAGTIFLKNGKIVDGIEYKYNVYRNLLYFKLDKVEYEIASPDSIEHMLMDGKKYVYAISDPVVHDKKRLLEVAVEGNATMYVNYYPIILPANYIPALQSGNVNETVSIKESYLVKVGAKLTVLDKKGKLLPHALDPKEQEIRAFIKNEHLSIKSRADIEKVVCFYNTLK